MARRDYDSSKQFHSIDGLKKAICGVRQSLVERYIYGLYHSTPRRLLGAIDSDGRATKY